MTFQEFQKGTKYYRNCGGQRLTDEKEKVWYDLLKEMDFDTYRGAVKMFISEEKEIARLNFVASIKEYAVEYGKKAQRERYLERKRLEDEKEAEYKRKVLEEFEDANE